jgi:hypothetical protein
MRTKQTPKYNSRSSTDWKQKNEAAQRDQNERHDPMAPLIERFQNQRMTSEQFSNNAPNQN